jgi:hypothetical protein
MLIIEVRRISMKQNNPDTIFKNMKIKNGTITQLQLVTTGEFNLPEGTSLTELLYFAGL